MKKFFKNSLAVLSLGLLSAGQVFADGKITISTDIDSDGKVATGMGLGFKILIAIFAASVVFGVIKGLIAYSTARDQEKKQILASTVVSAIVALIVALAIFGVVALFLNKMGMGDVIKFT